MTDPVVVVWKAFLEPESRDVSVSAAGITLEGEAGELRDFIAKAAADGCDPATLRRLTAGLDDAEACP